VNLPDNMRRLVRFDTRTAPPEASAASQHAGECLITTAMPAWTADDFPGP
jgi:hypothetical protein